MKAAAAAAVYDLCECLMSGSMTCTRPCARGIHALQRVAELEEERDKAEEERDTLLGVKEKLTGELAGMREAAHEAVRQVRLEQVKVGGKRRGRGRRGHVCARTVHTRCSAELASIEELQSSFTGGNFTGGKASPQLAASIPCVEPPRSAQRTLVQNPTRRFRAQNSLSSQTTRTVAVCFIKTCGGGQNTRAGISLSRRAYLTRRSST